MDKQPKIKSTILKSEYILHKTKKNVLIRFLSVLLIILLYFGFASYKYGFSDGFLVTFLTWSFFVFCTPIADAGFLLDFPIRLVTKIRMIYSEIAVWIIASTINIYSLKFNTLLYEKTKILNLFKYILIHPWPFWSIILVSGLGTFISIYFGDELIDVVKHEHREKYKKHKNKHLLLLIFFLIIAIIILYKYLLHKMGINLSF